MADECHQVANHTWEVTVPQLLAPGKAEPGEVYR